MGKAPYRKYTKEDDDTILHSTRSDAELSHAMGLSEIAIQVRRHRLKHTPIKSSPYPIYNQCQVIETDKVLILPDCEAPFQNGEFISKVVKHALDLGVNTLICAGDLFHLESLKGWEPEWVGAITAYMDDNTKDELLALMDSLPVSKRQKGLEIIMKTEEKMDHGFGEEVREAKKFVNALNVFENKYHIMGNHEGRLLRQVGKEMEAVNLGDLFGMAGWNMSEYYHCEVMSGGEKWRIAHPKPYAKTAPAEMASRHLCNYAMGHSHDWQMRKDRSGSFWAIAMGHCANEGMFPYESQRDRTYWKHVPGAMIIIDGYPTLMDDKFPFGSY
jgi:hypothetical protein